MTDICTWRSPFDFSVPGMRGRDSVSQKPYRVCHGNVALIRTCLQEDPNSDFARPASSACPGELVWPVRFDEKSFSSFTSFLTLNIHSEARVVTSCKVTLDNSSSVALTRLLVNTDVRSGLETAQE